ncbi:hypothetical protein D3C78_1819400 [compost metagenome]
MPARGKQVNQFTLYVRRPPRRQRPTPRHARRLLKFPQPDLPSSASRMLASVAQAQLAHIAGQVVQRWGMREEHALPVEAHQTAQRIDAHLAAAHAIA